MRKKEQKLWDRMRHNLTGRGILLERLENAVGTGRPDVDALCRGLFTPIELKAVDRTPARTTTKLMPSGDGLSVAQRNWHLAWRQHGGKSLIVIGVGSNIALGVEGEYADLVNDWSLETIARHAITATWSELAVRLGARPKAAEGTLVNADNLQRHI